jgi:predicted regulator of Ras-like GTPase activity (Roadblock/LC7/MglB family)
MESTSHNDLTWMLDELAGVPAVNHAVVLSTDGLIVQKSGSLTQDAAELFSAAASSMSSVAAATGRHFASGPVQQVVIEYLNSTLFIASAGENARLAVLCDQDVDMGTIAYEMGRLVTRIGQHLGAEARVTTSVAGGNSRA